MIKLYYSKRLNNFGDILSPIVVDYMMDKRVEYTHYLKPGKLLAIGSILRALKENDVVWGSGSMYDNTIIPPNNVKFLAVRGPLTRDLIKLPCPEIYGDPALLMPKIYKPQIFPKHKRYKIGVIPHKVDYYLFSNINSTEIRLIDITSNPYSIIDAMHYCDVIISTSLHGIIVAEAYNIPAIWLRVSDNILGGDFKFHDYLLSTGRDQLNPIDIRSNIRNIDIFKMSRNKLPTPIINTEELEDSFYNYFRPEIGD